MPLSMIPLDREWRKSVKTTGLQFGTNIFETGGDRVLIKWSARWDFFVFCFFNDDELCCGKDCSINQHTSVQLETNGHLCEKVKRKGERWRI